MKKLQLYDITIDDESALALSQCCHKVEHLIMKNCNLTTIGWKTVFDGIANIQDKVIFDLVLFSL